MLQGILDGPLKKTQAVGDRWCIAGVAGSGLGLCVDPTQIGWRAEVIDGGYQSYRNLVHDVSKTP
jgi:tRNA 2-selenouridine synthase